MTMHSVTCEVGGRTREQLLAALEEQAVQLNDSARTLLADPCFAPRPAEQVRVVFRDVASLGLPAGGTLPQILDAAQREGLAPCPPDTGPALRLALRDQEQAPDSVLSAGRAPTGALHLLGPRLREDPEYPRGFYLRVVDGVTWLRGFRCDDEYLWPAESVLALRQP